jgi:hypothetical protein
MNWTARAASRRGQLNLNAMDEETLWKKLRNLQ